MLYVVKCLLPKGCGKCFQGKPSGFSWGKYSYKLLATSCKHPN
jgi:hypothetical protein